MDNHYGQKNQPRQPPSPSSQCEPTRSTPVSTSSKHIQPSQLQLALQNSQSVIPSNFPIPPHLPTTSQSADESYIWMVRSFHETTEHNRYLSTLLQTKDAGLKIFHENEIHLKSELNSFQQRHKALEHDYHNLRSELQSLKPHSVPKAQHDEVVDQNKKIAENNAKLSQQNEGLLKEASQQQEMLSKLRAENGDLFGDSLKLRQENVELNETVKKLKESMLTGSSLKEEVEEVHDKLSKASAQILVVNSQLKSSHDQVNSLKDENHKLRMKVQNLDEERENVQKEKEQIFAKNREEVSKLKEKLKQRRAELQTRDNSFQKLLKEVEDLKQLFDSKRQEQEQLTLQLESESERVRLADLNVFEHNKTIEALRKELDDQKIQSERKSNFISALKKLLKKTEDEVKGLKTENDHLRTQINHKIDEIRKLKTFPSSLQTEKVDKKRNKSFPGEMEDLQLANNIMKKLLDENTLQLNSLEDELKKQKLVMSLQKTILDASDAKTKEMEEEIRAKDEKLEAQKEKMKRKAVRIQLLVSQLKKREVGEQFLHKQLDEERKHMQILEDQNQSQLDELEKQHKSNIEIRDELAQRQEKVNDLEESLRKYKAENIQHRELLDRALREKAQLKTMLRACNCPSLAKKIGDLKQLLQKHVATIQEGEEKIRSLRSHVSSLEQEGDENRKVIHTLRTDLNNSEFSFNEICYELRRVRNESKRGETSPSDHFHVEEVISSEDDDDDTEVRPVKKTRKSENHDDADTERHVVKKKIRSQRECDSGTKDEGYRARNITKKWSGPSKRKPICYP